MNRLVKCRKGLDSIKTGFLALTRDKLRGYLIYCLSGGRHRDGMNLTQAFVRNVGTHGPMLREYIKRVIPVR